MTAKCGINFNNMFSKQQREVSNRVIKEVKDITSLTFGKYKNQHYFLNPWWYVKFKFPRLKTRGHFKQIVISEFSYMVDKEFSIDANCRGDHRKCFLNKHYNYVTSR